MSSWRGLCTSKVMSLSTRTRLHKANRSVDTMMKSRRFGVTAPCATQVASPSACPVRCAMPATSCSLPAQISSCRGGL
eukprot:9578144-Alexandrium_andersonii.AAC.1